MSDKLIADGVDLKEIKKLLLKLFCADIKEGSLPESYDENLLLCCNESELKKLKELGYKTVTFAYSDKKINEKIGNDELERRGYTFEDGV